MPKPKIMRFLFLFVCFIYLSLLVNGQGTWGEDGEIEDAEIVIEKNRKIELPEAIRMVDKIIFPIKPLATPVQKYTYSDFKITLPEIESKVKVLNMKADSTPVLPRGYLKAAGGNRGTAYLEGWYGARQNNKYAFAIHGKHSSAQNGPVKNLPSAYSVNELGLFSRYFLEKVILTGNLEFSRKRANYYGRDPEQPYNADSLKQIYNNIAFQAHLQNRDSAKLTWKAGFGYNTFSDLFNCRETRFGLDFIGKYALSNNTGFSLNADAMLGKYQDSVSVGRNLFRFQPAWYFNKKGSRLLAGVNAAFENDTVKNTNRAHFYPNVKYEYDFIKTNITLFAELTGDVQRQTWQGFVNQNPWLKQNLVLTHTNKLFDLNAGLKGNNGSNFGWQAKVSYQNYNNLPLFVNNYGVDSSQFTIFYDRGVSKIFQASLLADYSVQNKYGLFASLDYFNYEMGKIKTPYHLPHLKASLNASVNLSPKFVVGTGLDILQGIKAATPLNTDTVKTLPVIINLHLKAEYKINSKFSAFVEADNLLSRKNERYLNYQAMPLQILGGLSWRF